MKRNRARLVLLALLFTSVLAVAGDKKDKEKKDEGGAADMSFLVVKDTNGKPVKYASVILHSVDKNGKQSNGGLQLKTSEEGKTAVPNIPYGKVRIQVIAKGFQTYGQDYDVNQPNMEITIKLKPPADQYTIYK